MDFHSSDHPWSVRDAKNKLSEVLRQAREKGPQIIGTRNQCVVVSREEWEEQTQPQESIGAWLLGNSPCVELTVPLRGESRDRLIPFAEAEL